MLRNICVVMSTYNGEKYLPMQLDSLLNQKGVNIIIYIRDDGSTDNTPSILTEYSRENDNIIVSLEKNVGYKKSFMKALKDAPESDYYGFCDQDDCWFPEKLYKTLCLMDNTKSSLALGNAIVTDEELNEQFLLYSQQSIPSYPMSLTSSSFHGFLFCFDRHIRELAIRFPIEEITIPHDFWIITIASLFGTITYDLDLVLAKYRRLPNSVSKSRPIKMFFHRMHSFLFTNGIVEPYSKRILELYKDELVGNKKELVNACAYYKISWKEKKYLLHHKEIKRKYKIKVFFNRL